LEANSWNGKPCFCYHERGFWLRFSHPILPICCNPDGRHSHSCSLNWFGLR
jgi:hypothetical protein